MKYIWLVTGLILFYSGTALAVDGMIDVQSSYNVQETADRLERILKEKGMTVFNRIKHSKGAAGVGINLRDTELILFGNPKVGSPLMKCQQSVAIDLPQKALIWKDSHLKVWISYNDPKYIKKRHDVSGCEGMISKIGKVLAGITAAAAAK
jgi:uncharacterized protein (DUF302 family)